MLRPPNSLKSRLAGWIFFLPTLLISGIDLVFTYNSTDKIASLVQEQLLKGSAKIISEQLVSIDGGYEISVPPAAFELFLRANIKIAFFYAVRSKKRDAHIGKRRTECLPRRTGDRAGKKYFLTSIRGEPVRVIAYAHELPNSFSNDYAITQVAQTLYSHDAFRKDLFFSR
ncbi:sensor histidine kinase N-terminal domain-containing protein [Undibacterium arcticum]